MGIKDAWRGKTIEEGLRIGVKKVKPNSIEPFHLLSPGVLACNKWLFKGSNTLPSTCMTKVESWKSYLRDCIRTNSLEKALGLF
jgi:hypothetical protein